jgi:hypothetical protein
MRRADYVPNDADRSEVIHSNNQSANAAPL